MALYAERNIVSFGLLTGFMCFEGRNVRRMLESTRFCIVLQAGFPDRHPALGVARSPPQRPSQNSTRPNKLGRRRKKENQTHRMVNCFLIARIIIDIDRDVLQSGDFAREGV